LKSASVRKTGIWEWSVQMCQNMLIVLNSIFTHVLVCLVSSITFRNHLFSYTILAYLCTDNCASLLAMIWAFAADSFRVGSRPWTWDYWESWCENSLQTSHLLFPFPFLFLSRIPTIQIRSEGIGGSGQAKCRSNSKGMKGGTEEDRTIPYEF